MDAYEDLHEHEREIVMTQYEADTMLAVQQCLPDLVKELRIANRLKAYALKLNPRLETSHRNEINKILKDE